MASCNECGMAVISILRMLVSTMIMLITPHKKTTARACCQVKPMVSTTVKVKNAFRPMPGACAKGTLAYTPMISVAMTVDKIVATKTAP